MAVKKLPRRYFLVSGNDLVNATEYGSKEEAQAAFEAAVAAGPSTELSVVEARTIAAATFGINVRRPFKRGRKKALATS